MLRQPLLRGRQMVMHLLDTELTRQLATFASSRIDGLLLGAVILNVAAVNGLDPTIVEDVVDQYALVWIGVQHLQHETLDGGTVQVCEDWAAFRHSIRIVGDDTIRVFREPGIPASSKLLVERMAALG